MTNATLQKADSKHRAGNLDTGNLNRQARLGAADTWAIGRGSMKE